MNYNVFFGVYLTIVFVFWAIIISYSMKGKMTLLSAISWMVASANVVGMVLFFCYKDSFVNKES